MLFFQFVRIFQASSIKDTEVLKVARDKQCLLITEDKDFGELTYRLKLEHRGIELVSEIIEKHFNKIENTFSVLTKKGLRIKTARK